jgi:hypothetical protein
MLHIKNITNLLLNCDVSVRLSPPAEWGQHLSLDDDGIAAWQQQPPPPPQHSFLRL